VVRREERQEVPEKGGRYVATEHEDLVRSEATPKERRQMVGKRQKGGDEKGRGGRQGNGPKGPERESGSNRHEEKEG